LASNCETGRVHILHIHAKVSMTSRFTIPPRAPGLVISVGWDNPLGTFFAQVLHEQKDDDLRDPIILWIGTKYGEVRRAEDLVAMLAPYAELTDEHLKRLRADRITDVDRGPTALQRAISQLGKRW
jgi:hypothetical protein